MAREILSRLILSCLLIAISATAVFSAREAPQRRLYNPLVRVIVDYALAMDEPEFGARAYKGDSRPDASLGASVPSA